MNIKINLNEDGKLSVAYGSNDGVMKQTIELYDTERDFMIALINAFYKRERDKITPTLEKRKGRARVYSEADRRARERFVGHFLGGFGFPSDWLDAVKSVIKDNGM